MTRNLYPSVSVGFCNFHCLKTKEAANQVVSFLSSYGVHVVVTPNMDHAQRLSSKVVDKELATAYSGATLSLCDSRILQKLIQWAGLPVPPVVTGSDLTMELFTRALSPEHRVLILGGSESQYSELRLRYPHLQLLHHNPSMGFINNAAEVESLCDLVKEKRADFIFLALGSPQQELLARKIKNSGLIRGVILCIGASLLFLTGAEQRAPEYLQQLRLEWLYRWIRNPRRLTTRYLANALAAPRILRSLRLAKFEAQ